MQVGIFAAACGLAVANIYYAQPLIGLMGPALGLRPGLAGLIVALTQLGYGAGLLFLVPAAVSHVVGVPHLSLEQRLGGPDRAACQVRFQLKRRWVCAEMVRTPTVDKVTLGR